MIDLRSDTVTKPSKEMLEAMFEAPVGDDVFSEDPSINELQSYAANLFGMEDSLFCSSGTQTNQIAINVHVQPGSEVICHKESHIYKYEGGGIAKNSGASVRLLDGLKKEFYPNNKTYRIAEYSAGLQNGSQKTYANNGKLELEISFKNGKNHGAWHYYFDSGLEAKLENWSEGLMNGEFKELDEKGLILSQEFYKKDIPIEKHIQNYPDGKPKYITIFDKKGNIIEETSFDESGVKTEIIKNDQ